VLSEIDLRSRVATCEVCGPTAIKKNGTDPTTGEQRWKCHGGLSSMHRLSEVDEANRTAWCSACRTRVAFNRSGARILCNVAARRRDSAYREANKQRIKDVSDVWREANRERLREQYRKRKYGLTNAEFAALVEEQGGVCAICGRPPSGEGREKELHIDHCHSSGAVRGLLCEHCNRGIGLFRDDPEILKKAAIYVGRDHPVVAPPS
jgi:hypothetical protein